MKTTIIDLLNKIANNEEPPKKILYEGIEYEWWESEYCKDYHNDIEGYLIDSHIITDILNNEVEIIEDNKKIEKIDYDEDTTYEWSFGEVYDKINEIIDIINKESEK